MTWNETLERMKSVLRRLGGAGVDVKTGALGQGEHLRDLPHAEPAVDVFEGEECLFMEIDLPGATLRDVGLSIDGSRLVVCAPSVAEPRHPALSREWEESAWYRAVDLRDDLDGARATARLKDGVLSVRVPRRRAAAPRPVPVKAG